MIINKERLISEKTKRAWTQSHLAEVCGVSLRTIQRIEKSGVTSKETIKALASVFEISVEDLIEQEISNKSNDMDIEVNNTKTDAFNYFSGWLNGKRLARIGLILILTFFILFTIIFFSGGPGIKFKGITVRPNNYNPDITIYYISSILSYFTLLPGIIMLGISQALYKFNKTWSYWLLLVAAIVFLVLNIKIGFLLLIAIALLLKWFSKKYT